MVAENNECAGSVGTEEEYGYDERIKTVEACAKKCNGRSSMFAFGTNDFDNPRCDSDGFCKCLCETGATKEGFCHQSFHSGYRLYRFGAGILLP